MTHFGSYDTRARGFDWSIAEKELEYRPGEVINIGWYCSDRICEKGLGDKPALLWEDATGRERRFTYNEIRLASNTIGAFLLDQGVIDGDR
ncbi:MAG TPA: hypothetical protein PKY95_12730, partial [candidate division Zixibacteria bacterium]|nr:hypothetical protein [candidate division Zixibacteria bacterium]